MADGSEGSKKISLTVKTAKDKQSVEIGEDASVKDVSRATYPCLFQACHLLLIFLQY